jgi:hypothetical protein
MNGMLILEIMKTFQKMGSKLWNGVLNGWRGAKCENNNVGLDFTRFWQKNILRV